MKLRISRIRIINGLYWVLSLYFLCVNLCFSQSNYAWLSEDVVATLSKIPGVSANANSITFSRVLEKPFMGSVIGFTVFTSQGSWHFLSSNASPLIESVSSDSSKHRSFEAKVFTAIDREGKPTW